MATLSITIQDANVPNVVAAVARRTGQDISSMTAPQKVQMMQDFMSAYLLEVWRSYTIEMAILAAGQSAKQTAAGLSL